MTTTIENASIIEKSIFSGKTPTTILEEYYDDFILSTYENGLPGNVQELLISPLDSILGANLHTSLFFILMKSNEPSMDMEKLYTYTYNHINNSIPSLGFHGCEIMTEAILDYFFPK
jgi:hypothetical protein